MYYKFEYDSLFKCYNYTVVQYSSSNTYFFIYIFYIYRKGWVVLCIYDHNLGLYSDNEFSSKNPAKPSR